MKPVALVILDGFGYSPEKNYNAIAQAKTPTLDYLFAHYPHTLLQASGKFVGLPDGMMGNSEVGHLTIGAGRVIKQPITIIHEAITDKSFFKKSMLVQKLEELRHQGGALHIMGLLSDAGVHSDIEHLYAYLDAAHQQGIKYVYIHAFLDGRDVAPQSASFYLEHLEQALTHFEFGSLGSLHGRFFAMDRDNHWDRTEKSYRVLTSNQDEIPQTWDTALEKQYARGITDEFFVPTQLDPTSTVQSGDGIIFFNVRPDRARQLTSCFVSHEFNHFSRTFIPLTFFITPVSFASWLPTDVLFAREPIQSTLKDRLWQAGKTIFSIAETEKYAHVTYFFTGEREDALPDETRVLIPSKNVENFAQVPQMSAAEITSAVLQDLKEAPHDFYLINYANADMVGHSGNLPATIQAIECLDQQLALLYDQIVQKMNGTLFITGDHGKAEQMYDRATGTPKTAHTANPVPFFIIQQEMFGQKTVSLKGLADIAPYIIGKMGLQ